MASAPQLSLTVGGISYAGWKTVRVTRGIECIAGSFDLSLTDRWKGMETRWPIADGDECALMIGGKPVITGYIDQRSMAYGAEERTLSVSGRDRTGSLVDCSAYLGKWEFLNTRIGTFVRAVAKPFGIELVGETYFDGGSLPGPLDKITVDPGDTAFDAIERACRMAGVLPVSDGQGGLVLTRAGDSHARTALVEGENILSASAEFDASGRYYRYVVMGQNQGNEEYSGSYVSSVRGSALDKGVLRQERVLVIRGESNVTPEAAVRRAQWEAKVRAGRGAVVNVKVQGWTQADGALWPVNARVAVRSPTLDIDGEMLIVQATYSLDEANGTTTELSLKRRDAFIPEPVVKNVGAYPELAGVGAQRRKPAKDAAIPKVPPVWSPPSSSEVAGGRQAAWAVGFGWVSCLPLPANPEPAPATAGGQLTLSSTFSCTALHAPVVPVRCCLLRQLVSLRGRTRDGWRGQASEYPSCTERCAQGAAIRAAVVGAGELSWQGAGPGHRFARSRADAVEQYRARVHQQQRGLLSPVPTMDEPPDEDGPPVLHPAPVT